MKKPKKKIYQQSIKRFLKKIFGTALKPRLAIFKSNKHIYGQIIDDSNGITLCSGSSISKNLKKEEGLKSGKNIKEAFNVGKFLGQCALSKGITNIVFDRSKNTYSGRVKSFAEGLRFAGLKF